MEPVMTLDEVLTAGVRIDASDAALAIRLARTTTASEGAAWALVGEAQQHAERLAGTRGFQAMTRVIADALLTRRELSGDDIAELLQEGAEHGKE
jgi:hypothetical protein